MPAVPSTLTASPPAPLTRLFKVTVLLASVPSVETASGPSPAFRDAATEALASAIVKVAFGEAAGPFTLTVPDTLPSAPSVGAKEFASAAGSFVSVAVTSICRAGLP